MPQKPFNFALVSRCPMCSAPAHRAHIEMVSETDDGTLLLYSRCGSCGIGLLACLSGAQHGMYGAAILTDVKKNEVATFAGSEPLTSDEVLQCAQDLDKITKK